MKGHEGILELRAADIAPKFVFINDYPCNTDWFEHSDHATVCTFKDPISSLDLRFLVGTAVSVSATSESRAKALYNACKRSGATVVAAAHVKQGLHPIDQDGWQEIWHKEKANG
jgi:hypothetical protein